MKKTLIIAFVLLSASGVRAQVEGTQYFMSSLPQVSIANPAFMPRYNFSIGLPGISSVALGYYNSGFSYNNLITKSNGEVKADLSKWVKSLADRNYITNTASVDLARIGLRLHKKVYLQLSSTAYSYSRAQIPKEIASLFVNGTAPLIGTNTHFSPQVEGLIYVETAAGVAFKVDNKLTLGIRGKYLKGIANATTVSSGMDISVGNDYQMTAAADMNLRTSGVHHQSINNARSNTGYGVDLGATYRLTDKLTLAASFIDLGRIAWKADVYSYTLDKATANYTFNGIDMKQLVAGNSDYLNSQMDSINKKFKPKETQAGSYTTLLPTKMYLSGNYQLNKNLSLGALFFTEKFQSRVNPGGTISLNQHVGKWLSASVSYSTSNRSYNNFGAGLSFNLAPIQFYVVGDNLLGIPASLVASQNLNTYVNNTKVFNLRFGLNFVWGRDKGLDKLQKNSRNVGGNAAGARNESVTSGTAKSLSRKKGTKKTKITSPSYLNVRKKKR